MKWLVIVDGWHIFLTHFVNENPHHLPTHAAALRRANELRNIYHNVNWGDGSKSQGSLKGGRLILTSPAGIERQVIITIHKAPKEKTHVDQQNTDLR